MTWTRINLEAALEELSRAPGKAELINGEVVLMAPTGDAPGTAGDEIYFSLRKYVEQTSRGHAVADNKAFRADLPHRQSFSPDAAFYTGPRAGMKFYPRPPVFAAEVRSEGDYGPRAEQEMAEKRADYFAAGTVVVWDVDLTSTDVVRKYMADDPGHATVFRRGELADAEPAVPGWRMAVDELFA
jgi:Uma2 family endonuclease